MKSTFEQLSLTPISLTCTTDSSNKSFQIQKFLNSPLSSRQLKCPTLSGNSIFSRKLSVDDWKLGRYSSDEQKDINGINIPVASTPFTDRKCSNIFGVDSTYSSPKSKRHIVFQESPIAKKSIISLTPSQRSKYSFAEVVNRVMKANASAAIKDQDGRKKSSFLSFGSMTPIFKDSQLANNSSTDSVSQMPFPAFGKQWRASKFQKSSFSRRATFKKIVSIQKEEGMVISLNKVIRRKSCYCSECGNLSALEKKHLDVIGISKREEMREEIREEMREEMYIQESETKDKCTLSTIPSVKQLDYAKKRPSILLTKKPKFSLVTRLNLMESPEDSAISPLAKEKFFARSTMMRLDDGSPSLLSLNSPKKRNSELPAVASLGSIAQILENEKDNNVENSQKSKQKIESLESSEDVQIADFPISNVYESYLRGMKKKLSIKQIRNQKDKGGRAIQSPNDKIPKLKMGGLSTQFMRKDIEVGKAVTDRAGYFHRFNVEKSEKVNSARKDIKAIYTSAKGSSEEKLNVNQPSINKNSARLKRPNKLTYSLKVESLNMLNEMPNNIISPRRNKPIYCLTSRECGFPNKPLATEGDLSPPRNIAKISTLVDPRRTNTEPDDGIKLKASKLSAIRNAYQKKNKASKSLVKSPKVL